jgi:hypothetical protein
MTITYTVEEYLEEDKTAKVTYYNEEGFVHTRSVNIPHNSDGSIDEEYFEEILQGQLRGVENKIKVGAVTFTEPTTPDSTQDPTETLT